MPDDDEPEEAPEPTPPQPVPDGLELRPDGRILMVTDKHRYQLKRPKYGELKTLRDLIAVMDDEALMVVADYQERVEELGDAPETARAKADHDIKAGALSRERRDALEQIRVDGMRKVTDMLSDKKLPKDSAQWETWMFDPRTFSAMLMHWQTVPLARGVS
jgi:hypothetical protein